MTKDVLRAGVLLVAVLFPGSDAPAQEAWWNSSWPYRRQVTVGQSKPSQLPGEDLAVVTMYTAGQALPDGSDLRVATFDRRDVPCRVLMTGPGDQVRLAFALRPGVTKYYAYFGNPKPAPVKPLEVQRGVLQETWDCPNPGGLRTLAQVTKLFSSPPGKLIGADIRDRIFMGHNPFGPQNRIATLFTGWLICQADGDYVFSSSSQDASFLLVDDKLVVDNGGLHQPQGDVSRQASITLKAGLHKLTFYHVCTLGDPVAVAAWGTPARKDIIPIPQASFAPFEKATAGMMERYSQSVDVDFIPVHAGEYFMVDRYFQRYVFDAIASGSAAKNIVWSWDFGDAQKSTAAKNEHVYLLPGKYTVTLAAKTPFGEIKRANQIFVSRPWDHVTENRLDTVKQHADIVAGYDFKGMDPAILAQAVLLLKRASHSDALMKAGAALVEQDKAPPEAISEVLPLYADALVARSKPDVAIEACLKAARMTPNPAVCAEMLVRAANITLEGKEDPNAALKLYQRVVKEYAPMTTHRSIRDARIGVGDAYRFAGNYDLALKAYEEARVRSEDVMKKAAIMRGDFSRQVEDYLRRRDYDAAREALERWEETFPMDKLDGYWSLLRGRLLASEGNYEAAIREAEVLVRVNSGSNYAPELLMIAADSYRKLAKADKATAVLQRIVKEYRDSPLAAEAAKKLKGK